MQMSPLPPSPPSSSPTLPQSTSTSTSTDNDYVGISALSNQIESLRQRLTPIIGNPVASNRDTNVQKQSKQTPSEIKRL